jgi:hypothetical protein
MGGYERDEQIGNENGADTGAHHCDRQSCAAPAMEMLNEHARIAEGTGADARCGEKTGQHEEPEQAPSEEPQRGETRRQHDHADDPPRLWDQRDP